MVSKILGNFGVRLISAIFNLLIAILVSRYVGAAGKGEQSIVLAMVAIITIFDNMVGGASIVYLASRLNRKNLFLASYLWTILVSVMTYFVLIFVPLVHGRYILSVVVLSGISSFVSIHSSILLGKEKLKQFNLLSFLVPGLTLLTLFLQFFFAWNLTPEAYVLALFVAYGCTFLTSILFVRNEWRPEESISNAGLMEAFKSLLFYGFQNQLAHVFQLLSFRLSYFFLERYCGDAEVGIYSNAVSVIESVWMISTSISLWQYARIANSTDVSYTKRITEQLTKYGLLTAFLALVVLLMIPDAFFTWLFGKEFHQLNQLMLLLAPGIWVFNYALIIGHYFSGHGRYLVNAVASGVGLIVTFATAYYFIPSYKIFGAAMAASSSYFVTSFIVIVYFYRDGGKFVIFPSVQDLSESWGMLKSHWSKSN
jgi:O-antigen/teichoic acid export membrane protein